jgi:hypothetical protein
LKFEEKKIVHRDSDLQFQDGPSLTWELTNFSENYYKESEPFLIDGHAFKLSLQYISEILQIKLSSVDYATLQNTKNNSELPIDFFQSYNPNPETILSAMYKLDIGTFQMEKSSIVSIFEDGVSYVELASISDFDYEKNIDRDGILRVQLFFKIKYTHSAIISQIAKNFNFYHTEKEIKLLSPDHLVFLYKFDFLEVMSEDQVLISFVNWYVENHEKVAKSTLNHILDNIRWNHISLKVLHRSMIHNDMVKEQPDMKRIFKNELERRMREMLQDKDSSEMYGVYLHKRDPRRSYVNFLRPETVTYMFDFIFSQLMEVELKELPVEANSGTNDSAAMISRNESSDNNLGLKFNDKCLDNSVSALAKVRLRDNRKNISVPGAFATPNKQNDDQLEQQDFDDEDDGGDDENEIEDDNGMGLMLHKMTPITDSRKKKMKGLFRDDISGDRPDVDLKEHQNKHAYKAPPNMASFDIPNNTFTKNSPEKDSHINNPRKAYVYINTEPEESLSSRADGLFERKEL